MIIKLIRPFLYFILAIAMLPLVAPPSRAVVVDRYIVGMKLRAFEAAWDKQTDEGKRKEAAAILEPITFTFLAGNLSKAAQLLDRARYKLVEVPPEERWADAIAVRVNRPLVNGTDRKVPVKMGLVYKPESPIPQGSIIHLQDEGESADKPGRVLTIPAHARDLEKQDRDYLITLPGMAGERCFTLRYAIRSTNKTLVTGAIPLVVVKDLEPTLAALDKKAQEIQKLPPSIARSTWLLLHGRLVQASQGKDQETDYPLARWLKDLEEGFEPAQSGKTWPDPTRPGPVWLALPLANSEKVVRIEGANRDGKTPMTTVVALHGAGGSENLFCEGHGKLAPKLAQNNGWMLVSPLNGPADDMLEVLSKWQPVDKQKVVTVGHSMGAANATAWASRKPEQLRAVAALGGGGRSGKGEVWSRIPFFVGVGDKDFALKGAKSLADSLKQAGATTVTLKIYPGLEHLTVVQASLEDVFAFFTKSLDQAGK